MAAVDTSAASVRLLQQRAADLPLALDVAAAARLLQYASLLLRWNAVHNLTSIAHPDEVLTHHLLDALALVPHLPPAPIGRADRVLDVGAGGGLPGIPLAIARPDLNVTLVDKVQKKVAFLRQAQAELALSNVSAVHARVEDLPRDPPFDLIVARAFASLDDFVAWTLPLLASGGRWIAMKGAVPHAELDALARRVPEVSVDRTVKLDVPGLHAQRHLLFLRRR